MLLATSRQGTCFLPILHLMAHFFGAYGVASVQAVADMLSLFLAVPLVRSVLRQVRAEQQAAIQTEQMAS